MQSQFIIQDCSTRTIVDSNNNSTGSHKSMKNKYDMVEDSHTEDGSTDCNRAHALGNKLGPCPEGLLIKHASKSNSFGQGLFLVL